MMHDGGWLGMGGGGGYWVLPVLIVAIAMFAWTYSRRRSGSGR